MNTSQIKAMLCLLSMATLIVFAFISDNVSSSKLCAALGIIIGLSTFHLLSMSNEEAEINKTD